MLDAGSNPIALDAPDIGSGQPTTQQWILGARLKQPATERRAMQVDRWTEDHVDILGVAFAGKHLADPLCRNLVPCLREQGRIGEQRDLLASNEFAAPDSGRAVAEDHGTEPEGFVAMQ